VDDNLPTNRKVFHLSRVIFLPSIGTGSFWYSFPMGYFDAYELLDGSFVSLMFLLRTLP